MNYLNQLQNILDDIIAPNAVTVDAEGAFPRAAMDALGESGLLGLVSAEDMGGLGLGLREASTVVTRIAEHCASTAMVLCMHYCATQVIESYARPDIRREIAAGRHISTLAFSEAGSRSHFWAPLGSAVESGTGVLLSGHKTMTTSACQADSYVWSSRPLDAQGASTLWLVSAKLSGLKVPQAFDGLGLRGNASAPIEADAVRVGAEDRLGVDGDGFDIMMAVVLPSFNVLNASCSVGLMEAALSRATAHVNASRLQHLHQSLADLPTIRAYLARARIRADSVRALLNEALDAISEKRADAMLNVLEIKAAAAEAALEVTDIAMRVCGGAAFRKEVGIERTFRDARAASVMAPTSDVLYDFIGKALCGLPLF